MRIFVTPYYCLVLLAIWLLRPAVADIIHLKNGEAIYADQTKQTATGIEYEKGDDSFTIPNSVVQSVEKTAAPLPSAPLAVQQLPAYTPEASAHGEEHLLDEILHGGKVDRSALLKIDSHGNRDETAIAYYIAGKQEFEAGDYGSARRDFENALRNNPQNPAILNFYASLLVKTGNAQQAIIYAQQAVAQAPDSADAYAVLGYAQYSADRPKEAIQSWKKSLALRPDASIQQILARAQREKFVESNYSERETGHFVLRYEGAQSSEALRAQILEALESAYRDLSSEFARETRATIPVVLYTSQDFFDVTRAPGWVGALNDGQIRIPLRGMNSVTPTLARILRHELAHSFINQVTQGRCPQWLNEGIAQMLEPRSLSGGA